MMLLRTTVRFLWLVFCLAKLMSMEEYVVGAELCKNVATKCRGRCGVSNPMLARTRINNRLAWPLKGRELARLRV